MSAGARLVRPPEIRRSRVKQRDPGSRSRPTRPSSRPGAARGRGFRRPPRRPLLRRFSGGSPGPRRLSPGLAGEAPRTAPARPPRGPATSTPAPSPPRPKSPPFGLPRAAANPCSTRTARSTSRSHSGKAGDFSAPASVRGRLRADFAPKNFRPQRRSDGPKRARSRHGAGAATKNGGPHKSCPRRRTADVAPDKCAVCPRKLAGFRRARGFRRKTGGRTTHARAEEPPMLRPINAPLGGRSHGA